MLNNMINKFKSNNEVKFIVNKSRRITVVDNNIIELLPQIGADALAIMIYNLKFQNSKTHNISIKSLAKGTGIGEKRVAKALKILAEYKLITREDIYKNNLRTGCLYTVNNSLESIDFSNDYRNCNNDHCEFGNGENDCTKKQNKQNKNNKKENGLLVSVNPKLDLILNSFKENGLFLNKKIEKLLKDNLNNFDAEVFNKIFENIANSREKINNVLSYISRTLKVLKDKGIKTLEEFLKDQESYFGTKKEVHKETTKKEIKKDNGIKRIHTRHHDIEQTFTKYEEKELEEMLLRSQRNKFKSFEDKEENKEKNNNIIESENSYSKEDLKYINMKWEELKDMALDIVYWERMFSNNVREFIKTKFEEIGLSKPFYFDF